MDKYVLVTWPEVQDLMGEDWFREECFLANPINEEQAWINDSAYFVPEHRLNEYFK